MLQDDDKDWIKPLQRQNLGNLAYGELKAALMRGELKPGTVMTLRPLSQKFGISATPMREALMRLIAESALDMDANGRVCVPHLTRAKLMEIRQIREYLEGESAWETARLNRAADADELEEIHNALMNAHNNGQYGEAIAHNTRFHLKLCELAQRPIAVELASNLWMRIGPLLSHLYDAGTPANWHPHPHQRIVNAVRIGDPEMAREALIFDIRGNGEGLLAHVLATEAKAQRIPS